jgi:hypothetical protein
MAHLLDVWRGALIWALAVANLDRRSDSQSLPRSAPWFQRRVSAPKGVAMIFFAVLLPRERVALPDGREWRGPHALRDAARALIGEGADPDAKMLGLRNGREAREGTIAAFAGRQWSSANCDPQFEAPERPGNDGEAH